jgi:multiple sugar transport system permease protein
MTATSTPDPSNASNPATETPAVATIDPARAGQRLVAAGIILMSIWVLLPIYLIFVNALSSPADVAGWPKRAFPAFDLGSLAFFLNYAGVVQALVNSIIVAVLTMIMSIGLGAPAGYAMARFRFRGKESFRWLVVLTRAFPLPLLALPLAVLFIRTGMDDTLFGLALVHMTLALPFAVLITYSLFSGIQGELEEAAWTLGCTRWQAVKKVVLPLATPGIAASGVFAFVTSWNEVFAAAVLTVQNRTLTAFLVQSLDDSPLHLKFAGALVLILPALVFLFAVRKYLFSLWGISNR